MDWGRWIRSILALASAAAPLAGVVWGGWDVREVLLLYWAENLVIGFWQVVKMACARRPGEAYLGIFGKLFLIPFFIVHYGGFCAGHGLFINLLTGNDVGLGGVMEGAWGWGPLVFVGLLIGVIKASVAVLPAAALWAVMAMTVSHAVHTWQTFFATGRYRKVGAEKLMGEPYKHIVVIHIAIIIGGAAAAAMSNGIPVLVLLVLGKLGIDFRGIWGKEKEGGESAKSAD